MIGATPSTGFKRRLEDGCETPFDLNRDLTKASFRDQGNALPTVGNTRAISTLHSAMACIFAGIAASSEWVASSKSPGGKTNGCALTLDIGAADGFRQVGKVDGIRNAALGLQKMSCDCVPG